MQQMRVLRVISFTQNPTAALIPIRDENIEEMIREATKKSQKENDSTEAHSSIAAHTNSHVVEDHSDRKSNVLSFNDNFVDMSLDDDSVGTYQCISRDSDDTEQVTEYTTEQEDVKVRKENMRNENYARTPQMCSVLEDIQSSDDEIPSPGPFYRNTNPKGFKDGQHTTADSKLNRDRQVLRQISDNRTNIDSNADSSDDDIPSPGPFYKSKKKKGNQY